jgi:hypothetical protein
MARYLETAREANELAKKLLLEVDESKRPEVAEMIARLVNFGIRCSPRGVQHTVRLNAVREAVRDLPVHVSMVQKVSDRGRTYNALVTQPIGCKIANVEGDVEE